MTELAFTVGAPAYLGGARTRSWSWSCKASWTAAGEKGQYLELGARPTFGQGVTLAVPVKVGLSLGDYYEGLRGDERFGFFSVGGIATVPLSSGGRWNLHGGAEYIRLGDRNQLVLGKEHQVVVSGGIGLQVLERRSAPAPGCGLMTGPGARQPAPR